MGFDYQFYGGFDILAFDAPNLDILHPAFNSIIERKHQWESGWTTIPVYLQGKVSKRFDAARTLNLSVPNAHGQASDDWKVGDRIRARLGWNGLEPHPIFEGVIPPMGLSLEVGPPPSLAIFAVDAVGLLATEGIYINASAAKTGTDEISYLGWEGGAAIRDIMATSFNAALLGDLSAIKGSSPIRWIGKDITEPSNPNSRKAYIDAIRTGLTDDETSPDIPKAYHYWQTAKADGTPVMYLQKERNPSSTEGGNSAIRTIDTTIDLIRPAVQQRTDQKTSALVTSSSDSTKSVRFTDDDSSVRYGRLESSLSLATANTDDLLALGRRTVNALRYPVRSYVATVRDGLRHELNQVLQVNNPRYGGSGKFLITQIDHHFNPGQAASELRLAAPEELLTEALASLA